MNNIRSLSQLIHDLQADLKGEEISLAALLESFHERGFGAILLLFATPMALPLPVPPGINVALASPLLLLTAQQALGRHTIWLPESWKRRTLSCRKIEKLTNGMLPWLEKLEKLVHPRLGFITGHNASRFFGFLGLLMALSVCIPVPLTNTVPSLGIALMAAGTLMRDGLTILAGAFIGTAWVLMLVCAVIFLGPEAFDITKDFIKSLI